MSTNDQPHSTPAQYRYYRGADGCDDAFFIEDTRNGQIVMGIYFWDDHTGEAAEAEAKAKLVVQALSMPGGWVEQYHVAQSTLQAHQMIATLWSIHDVQNLRADLSDDEAWLVLQLTERRRYETDQAITSEMLRLIAEELFPVPAAS
jgi:hypothetical protein